MIVYQDSELVMVCENEESEKDFLMNLKLCKKDVSEFERSIVHGNIGIERKIIVAAKEETPS